MAGAMMFGSGIAAAAGAVEDPVVTLSATNVTRSIDTVCYANLRYDTSGVEYENTGESNNYSTSRGNWLDAGSSSAVWFERTINSGSLNNVDPGAGRLQMSSTRSLSVVDTNLAAGGNSCNLDIEMWDAASGGSLLDSVAGLTLSATYFDACPTCCFPPDTLITMADGTYKPIGNVKEGELIEIQGSFNEKVGRVIVRENRPMAKLRFEDGRELILSLDHPIYIKGKGPACVASQTKYKNHGVPAKLEIGDYAKTEAGILIKLVSIESYHYPSKVYTFSNSRFFAGGIMVY